MWDKLIKGEAGWSEGEWNEIIEASEAVFKERNLRTGLCVPTQEEEETVTEIEETQDEVPAAVVKADETVEFVSTETPQAIESIVAPHTGFAAQNGSNFLPIALGAVAVVAATVIAIIVAKRKK